MKIGYNPPGQSPLTTASVENNDIIFDIPALAIWAKGNKFDCTGVKQINNTLNADYRVLLSKSASDIDDIGVTLKSNKLIFNPYKGELTTTTLNVSNVTRINGPLNINNNINSCINFYNKVDNSLISQIHSISGYNNDSKSYTGNSALYFRIFSPTSDATTVSTTGYVDYMLTCEKDLTSRITRKIWHEGNDGENSGLDADLLDGKHASEFVKTTDAIAKSDTVGIYGASNDGNFPIIFTSAVNSVTNARSYKNIYTDTANVFYYNPSKNVLNVPGVTAQYFGHAWSSEIKPNVWSRLCLVNYCQEINVGTSFIINIQEHRSSVVYNLTYLVNTHFNKQGHVTLLNHSNYKHTGTIFTRVVVAQNGSCYFELKDSAYHTDNNNRTLVCRLLPIASGSITTYNSFVSGETIPTDYSASTEHMKIGNGIPNLDMYWRQNYNINGSKSNTSTITIPNNSISNGSVVIYSTEIQNVPQEAQYNIQLSSSQQFCLYGLSGSVQLVNEAEDIVLYPKYSIKIDGNVVASTYNLKASLQDSLNELNYSGIKQINGNLKIEVILIDIENKDKIYNGAVVKMNGSPGMYKINDINNFMYTTYTSVSDWKGIEFNYEISRPGGILRNQECGLYNNGQVHTNNSTNSVTYFNDDLFFIKRGNYCLQINNQGMKKSTDDGNNWTNI